MNRYKREQNERIKQRQARQINELMAAIAYIGSPEFQEMMRRGFEAMARTIQEVVRQTRGMTERAAERATEDADFRQQLREKGLLELVLPGYDGPGRR